MGEGKEKMKPEEWARLQGVKIVDPDGWRHDAKDFDEPVTEEEFNRRLVQCTIMQRIKP